MKFLVTGSKGFFGKNLIAYLKQKNYKFYCFNKQNSISDLKFYISKSDIVFHLAGEVLNHSNISSHIENNVNLTSVIVNELNKYNGKTLFFSSTIHASEKKNSYGETKYQAEKIIIENLNKTNFYKIIRYPHLFGAYAKKNHNSVLTTWIYNEIEGKESKIISRSIKMEYGYIYDVIEDMLKDINNLKSELRYFKKTYKINLGQLNDLIRYIIHNNDKIEIIKYISKNNLDLIFFEKLLKTVNYYLGDKK